MRAQRGALSCAWVFMKGFQEAAMLELSLARSAEIGQVTKGGGIPDNRNRAKLWNTTQRRCGELQVQCSQHYIQHLLSVCRVT